MRKSISKYTLGALTGLAIVYFGFMKQLNLVANVPGTVNATAKLVHVQQPADRTAGHFYITSVGEYRRIPPLLYLYLKYYKHADFEKESDVYSKQETVAVEEKQGAYDMEGAQQNAVVAAYNAAKIPYKIVNRYVRIRFIYEGSHASKKLKLNDRIIQLNDTKVEKYADYAAFMAKQKDHAVVQITVLREKQTYRYDIPLLNFTPKAKKPTMGIGLDLVDEAKARPLAKKDRVKFNKVDAGGPSGGLMYALEIYNELIEGDITKGRKIAGTGEIDAAGQVGPIGGVNYKVIGAKEKGAKIFLAPEWNAKEARATAAKIGGIKVVSVRTIDDAIRYLTTTGN